MKLWQKIFLSTIALVMIAINITSFLLNSNYHKLSLELKEQNAVSNNEYISANIKNIVIYRKLSKGLKQLSYGELITAFNSVLISQQGNSTQSIAILSNEKVLSSINNPAIISMDIKQDNISVKTIQNNNSFFLITASNTLIDNATYTVYMTNDISDIFIQYNIQNRFASIISVLLAVVIGFILLVIVNLLLKNLIKINLATRKIASGNYKETILVKGTNELSELAENMNTMAKAIDENTTKITKLAENRKMFIANLAHEMKTPLTSILGFADLLKVKRFVTDEQRLEYASIITDETKRLRSLSSKLMELITTQNAIPQFNSVDISLLIKDTSKTLQPILKSKNITLVCYTQKLVAEIDEELFKSLLINLIDNAIKASSENSEILIKMKDNKISITDYGIGMEQSEIDKISEPFYMVDKSRSKKSGGTGLGLALCVEIAKLHQVALSFESEPLIGTTATITFKGGLQDE